MSDEPVIRQEHLRRGAVAACVVGLLLAARCAGEAAGSARPAGAVGVCSTVTVLSTPTPTSAHNGGVCDPAEHGTAQP